MKLNTCRAIKVKSKSMFKNSCFTGGFKGQYIMNTTTDVTQFWSNQIITLLHDLTIVIAGTSYKLVLNFYIILHQVKTFT